MDEILIKLDELVQMLRNYNMGLIAIVVSPDTYYQLQRHLMANHNSYVYRVENLSATANVFSSSDLITTRYTRQPIMTRAEDSDRLIFNSSMGKVHIMVERQQFPKQFDLDKYMETVE